MSDNQLFQSIKYELKCDSLKANEIYTDTINISNNISTNILQDYITINSSRIKIGIN